MSHPTGPQPRRSPGAAQPTPTRGEVSRRSLLGWGALAAGSLAGAPLLSACGGGGSSSGQTAGPNAEANLVLSSWQIPTDIVTYKKFAAEYTKTHPKVKIKVQETPGGDFNQWFTTQLAGGGAPDIIRITWQQFGRYAQNGGLVAMNDYLPAGYGKDFGDTFWKAAQYKGKTFGIPQHTDTFATYYRTELFKNAGISVPGGLAQAWTWDQFMTVADQVKKATGKYALTYGFGGVPTAYRWLPFLYMHGGSLFEADGKTPAIDNTAGVEAIAWFQNLYNGGYLPKSNTIKGSADASTINAFVTGQAGMMIYGDWLMSDVAKGLKQDQWDVTYMPRDVSAASDLGGNLLSVTKDAQNPAVAADFIQFICSKANMKYFCEHDLFLPVRTSLTGSDLSFASQQSQMALFSKQATTVPADMAAIETGPLFNPINQVLADQLDLCFTGQKSPQATAKAIAQGVAGVVG